MEIMLIGHTRPDLDCRLSKAIIKENYEVLEEKEVDVNVDVELLKRIAAEYPSLKVIAVDVGKTDGKLEEGNLVVYDHHGGKAFKSAVEVLSGYFEVPEQALEAADNPKFIKFGETGAALLHYRFSDEELLELARNGELQGIPSGISKELKAEFIAKIDEAKRARDIVSRGKSYGNLIVVREFSMGGFLAAYEAGYDYYVAVTPHRSGVGYTFVVNANTDEGIKISPELGESLKKIDPRVFVHPAGFIAILGGPKNPEVKIEEDPETEILSCFGI